MAKTIGNPLSWTARQLGGAAQHVATSVEHIGADHAPLSSADIRVRTLTLADLREALRRGAEDLGASRTDAVFIALVYPVIGLVLAGMAFNANLIPLLFPLIAGFALLGPFAAVGLYEISRRREQGLPASWTDSLSVASAPNFGAVLVLGFYLLAVFIAWMVAAHVIFALTVGPDQPASLGAFLTDVFTTPEGWTMIVAGTLVGGVFAATVLALSVVSVPLLLDRDVGVPTAIVTSLRVARRNPVTVAAWGAIVAGLLILGSIPALAGLILVLPLLGHATWHLYRSAVEV